MGNTKPHYFPSKAQPASFQALESVWKLSYINNLRHLEEAAHNRREPTPAQYGRRHFKHPTSAFPILTQHLTEISSCPQLVQGKKTARDWHPPHLAFQGSCFPGNPPWSQVTENLRAPPQLDNTDSDEDALR